MDFKGELYSVIIVHRTVLRLLRELESCAGLEGMGEGGGGRGSVGDDWWATGQGTRRVSVQAVMEGGGGSRGHRTKKAMRAWRRSRSRRRTGESRTVLLDPPHVNPVPVGG